MSPYTFPVPRKRAALQQPRPHFSPESEAPPPVMMIQGKMPQSRNEYYVALALYQRRIPFWYQVALAGGTRLRGGVVVDFVIYNPFPTAVLVEGAYWHRNKAREDLIMRVVRRYFRFIKVLTDSQTSTPQKALAAVRRLIG